MKLSVEQTEWYSAMDALFLSKGWQLLLQGWRKEHNSLAENTFLNATDMTDVAEARVRHRLLDELITLPASIEKQKQEILDQLDEDEIKNIYE